MEYTEQIIFIVYSIYFANCINQTNIIDNKGDEQSSNVTLTSIPLQESFSKQNYRVRSWMNRSLIHAKNIRHGITKQTPFSSISKQLRLKMRKIKSSDPTSPIKKNVSQEIKKKHKNIARSSISSHSVLNNNKCNDAILRKLIIQNIHSIPAIAKRQIQLAIRNKFNGFIDAICSTKPFSYLINSDLYCEVQKFNVTCLVFRQTN